jgi:hypothetical protein
MLADLKMELGKGERPEIGLSDLNDCITPHTQLILTESAGVRFQQLHELALASHISEKFLVEQWEVLLP